jgi:GMP synthase (glutamine-hydrolysing)
MKQPQILIIDLSSQVASVIERTLRELEHRSVILGPDAAEKWLEKNRPNSIILSGGQQSVYDDGALMPPEEILELGIPVFGICFGMQYMAYKLGGKVVANTSVDQLENKNYGETPVRFSSSSDDYVFKGFGRENHLVWASHGDSVLRPPEGFLVTGWTGFGATTTIMAMAYPAKGLYAVQFHPEVSQTAIGKEILRRFVEDACGCDKDWSAEDFIDNARKEIAYVMKGKKAILAYSGGVDSSVTGAIAHPILEERLSVFTVDTGALRENEMSEIVSNGKEVGFREIKVVYDSRAYFAAIGNATDAEEKRKLFQSVYGPRLDREGKIFKATFVFQGTNKADRVESGRAGKSAHIKTHHNEVELKLKKYNPLQDLFKYEIRALAYKLGLSEAIAEREPFPGPGLFLRVNGIPPTQDKIAIVRWANVVVDRILRKHGIHKEISQCPVSLNGIQTVGIKGDGRVYKYSIDYHPVQTMDFMTSRGYYPPEHVHREIVREVSKHPEVVRVKLDSTDKPPASTEPE